MKNTLLVIVVLLVGACATTPTMKSVAGEYENIEGEDIYRCVFLENGVAYQYINGKKENELKWEIVDWEIRVIFEEGTAVCSVNFDSSITFIAIIDKDGERENSSEEEQEPIKKTNNYTSPAPHTPSKSSSFNARSFTLSPPSSIALSSNSLASSLFPNTQA